VVLDDGTVLFTGLGALGLEVVQYEPATGAVKRRAPLPEARPGHRLLRFPQGVVLAGGSGTSERLYSSRSLSACFRSASARLSAWARAHSTSACRLRRSSSVTR